jgi:2-dehydro-3-deoxyphosphooctonate aldolase (KDO 8-P synthase)
MIHQIKIGKMTLGAGKSLFLIGGPCAIESEELVLRTAETLKKITSDLDIPFIFKSSYDKANRSSIHSFRGPGIEKGLAILQKVKEKVQVPVLSDIHHPEEVGEAVQVLDILQIPAFLCRQTDLLLAAAKSGKPVNVKKGQFLAPWDMGNIVEKITSTGNHQILLTERGMSFGYNNLVVDMRSIPIMKQFGFPVVFDATHSVQLPGAKGNASGGQREFVPSLARAAVAAECDGLFMEIHPDPESALSDGPNMVRLDDVKGLLEQLKQIHEVVMNTGGSR